MSWPAQCGTDSGYFRHRRVLKEPACPACVFAHTRAGARRAYAGRYTDPPPDPPPESQPEESRPAWMARGACVGCDPDLFFPEKGGRQDDYRAARAVCSGCPVRLQCLEYAISYPETFGFWGGRSERERRAIRKQRRLSA